MKATSISPSSIILLATPPNLLFSVHGQQEPPVAEQTAIQLRITNTPIVWSEVWDMELKWLSGGFGFDNIMGVPIEDVTEDPDAVLAVGGAVVANRATSNSSAIEPLMCASGEPPQPNHVTGAVSNMGGTRLPLAWGFVPSNPMAAPQNFVFEDFTFFDGTPLCFSWPVLGASLNRTDIRVTLNTGESFFPDGISTAPNQEENEKHCIVIFMDLGNRIVPNGTNDCMARSEATNTLDSCAFYPKRFEIVDDLYFVGPPDGADIEDGPWGQNDVQLKNGKGLFFLGWPDGPHPYIDNSGPFLIGAHLSRLGKTVDGDDGDNDCPALYPQTLCQYRLRFFFTGGYSPNGVSAMRPTDYEDHWRLVAVDGNGNEIALDSANQEYSVGNGGLVTIIGLADLGQAQDPVEDCVNQGSQEVPPKVAPVGGGCYDRCYTEDYDNYIDIILAGNDEGMLAIRRLEQPADGSGCYREFYETGVWKPCVGKQPLYNPGGGGNVRNPDPYFDNYVAGSPLNTSIDVVVDLDNRLFVSFDSNVNGEWILTEDPTESPTITPAQEVPTDSPTLTPSFAKEYNYQMTKVLLITVLIAVVV